jgi:hypothetical protein
MFPEYRQPLGTGFWDLSDAKLDEREIKRKRFG